MESLKNRVGALLESYIEKKEVKKTTNPNPKKYIIEKINNLGKLNKTLKECSSIEQEVSVKKFIKENKNFNLNGKTKRGSLVFINGNDKVLIRKDGKIQ